MDINNCSKFEFNGKVENLKIKELKVLLADVTELLEAEKKNFFPETLCYDDVERRQIKIARLEYFKQVTTAKLEERTRKQSTEQTIQISFSTALLNLLQENGFIEDKTAKPIKWIALHTRSKGYYNNFAALLDLLCLLDCPDQIIKDRKQINANFSFLFNAKIKAQNYTSITDIKGKLKRPIISEHHTILTQIVAESRKK